MGVSAKSAPGTWPRREWPARLVNRLLGGLTTRIDPPGLASRRRYVLLRAADHGLALQAEAVERLAQTADGYRTLDGWIARLGLEAGSGAIRGARARSGRTTRAASPALDSGMVATILADEALLADPASTVDAIARAVAARFGVRLGVLRPAAGRRSSRLATWPSTWPGRSPAPASPPSAPTSEAATRPPSDTPARPPRGASMPIPDWPRSSPISPGVGKSRMRDHPGLDRIADLA